MNILDVFQGFQTQEQAIEYLEHARWKGRPVCPYCGSDHVSRHASSDRAMPRMQCQACHKAFAVTVGTIFHGTPIPLRSWFLVLALMLNAKKSSSAYQIARDTGIRRATVWSMMHRIRVAMASDAKQSALLHGIVEADETYIGGKPRKGNRKGGGPKGGHKSKRGRGTDKLPVLGAVERNGRVVAEPAKKSKLNSTVLASFIRRNVDRDASLLITDEYPGYNKIGRTMRHATINHQICYAQGATHTNTIEGFWSLIKRAWYGQHHHYSKEYADLYVSEACYKYNSRKNANAFGEMIGLMVAAA